MRFFAFHLMPYAHLDPAYDEKYNSAWVTLPNTYFDPQKGHELYNRYLDELEFADQCGFDGVGVNEHHQNAYGLMPIPSVIAGALARRTRGKIAVLGRALPLLNNPLVVAEEYAMLDQITGGRLIAGFVRGIGAEYHSWGINPTESHDRFHEAHDLIVRGWSEPGPFHYEGKYYDFEYVNTWPRPYQQPHPPVWLPSQGSTETIEFGAHPDHRYTYVQSNSPFAAVQKFLGLYRETARRFGYTASEEQLGWMAPTYVAETDEQAYEEAKPHIEFFTNKLLRMPPEVVRPPGYVSFQSYKAVMSAKSSLAGKRDIDYVLENGSFICGSPETVRAKIAERYRDAGFGNYIALLHFGTLPHALTRKSIELFATRVMPYLRESLAPPLMESAS